ncbi:uncharacterized protein LOC132637268 [Lycium barbarum]|uniref:uncharacterized protein LOC132637268 n=1 Tax=Lycium barbarum TaxID=112863 RepID=UPI00293E6A71|nr:uncharacterized protein LOC132637268 [Lycium barbarum]
MIISAWNVRELNKSDKYKEFKVFLGKNKLDLVGCFETRVKHNKSSKIQRLLGVDWQFLDNYNHAPNDRIWIGWKPADVVIEMFSSFQVIHCIVKDKLSSFSSYVTFVYGLHSLEARRPLWADLRQIYSKVIGPWIILGDFNSVLHADDRVNPDPVHHSKTADFQQCLDDIGDYTNVETLYMLPGCSDHTPVIINTASIRTQINKPYRLLNVMLTNPDFQQQVQDIWKQEVKGSAMYSICRKLKKLELATRGIHKELSSAEIKLAPTIPALNINIVRDGPCLSLSQQQLMLQPVTKEEIAQVVKALLLDKSPGMDRYPAEFYKQFWSVVGEEVTLAVIQFFQTGKLLKEVNCTNITLIPKDPNPTYVKQFRPIACCSTLHKIIAKILMVRLKTIVDFLVGPSQSAFIEGRNILDNVILAHELLKGYTQKSVSPRCMIKVDIRKAYDSMEWSFLRMLMLGLGIPTKMVNLIMQCVTTVSYTLLINGGTTTKFQAKRGLRQGDPMSLYLFVLVMEYLNKSLMQLRHNPSFKYHPRCSKLNIVHVCFADDLLMCCKADRSSIDLMLQAFENFSSLGTQGKHGQELSLHSRGKQRAQRPAGRGSTIL